MPRMQIRFPSEILLLHFRDEQQVQLNNAGAQLPAPATCCCDDAERALTGERQ